MKKIRDILLFSCPFVLFELFAIIFIATCVSDHYSFYSLVGSTAALFMIWFGGCIFLLFKKHSCRKLSKLLLISGMISIFALLLLVTVSVITATYPYTGDFSIQTPVFENKKVMVIVPHQDDDIILVGGIIEPYIKNNSDVTIVFTTNGDYAGLSETRAEEVLSSLMPLGVKKENIYYLGFGDQWQVQTIDNRTQQHICLSTDPDALWTSQYGSTETYSTAAIDCYLKLPYTKNNYLYSLKSLILEKRPEVIFAVDMDHHLEHKGASLLFEEAIGQLLKSEPNYHPTVYKGFCYGTGCDAADDYDDDINPLSTKKPDDEVWNATAFAYRWEDRVRFPIGAENLNRILTNNSVFSSFKAYRSAEAHLWTSRALNGDKVFWERRTDSLIYDAAIYVDHQETDLLNDFQLLDFQQFGWEQNLSEFGFCSSVECGQNKTIRIELKNAVTANSLYLYDHPDLETNILGGSITFSDGTSTDFSALEKGGSATQISFPLKQIEWLEITVHEAEGDCPGLTEIELYCDTTETPETFLMAVDQDNNFVYDYLLQEESAVLEFYQFPTGKLADCEDVELTFTATGSDCSYTYENGRLQVHCPKNETCTVTASKDGSQTTFTVSNPSSVKVNYTKLLQKVDNAAIRSEFLLQTVIGIIKNKIS